MKARVLIAGSVLGASLLGFNVIPASAVGQEDDPRPLAVEDVPPTPGEEETPDLPPTPTTPTEPDTPEVPTDPETPTEPELPVEPEEPVVPTDPETPAEPELPVEPEEPVVPTDPETPAEPELPVEPEEPVVPITPTVPGQPLTPSVPQNVDPVPTPRPSLPSRGETLVPVTPASSLWSYVPVPKTISSGLGAGVERVAEQMPVHEPELAYTGAGVGTLAFASAGSLLAGIGAFRTSKYKQAATKRTPKHLRKEDESC
ncbi:hypothetical protein [Flaviflexus sp.]|uniref:hypothetical protein n=2 Tax=Flaviflexus sp. TaxID=1969482 RepID=UPI003F8E4366